MRHILCFVIIVVFHSQAFAQVPAWELEVYYRYDRHPAFNNTINVVADYRITTTGNSWGVNAGYKLPLAKNLVLRGGLGYYRYAFSKVNSYHRLFGSGDGRVIDYPTTLSIVLGTDGYWYNCVNASIGLIKYVPVGKDVRLLAGLTGNNYFTFSQKYHMPYDNTFIPQPSLQIQNDYKTKQKRYFGFGANVNLGFLKTVGRMEIGATANVPVFDIWKQDQIFPTEVNSGTRQKFFRGIGASILFSYPLTK